MSIDVVDAIPAPDSQNPALSLLTDYSTLLEQSGSSVRKKVVEVMVEKEVNLRVELLTKALEKRKEAEKELKKVDKPDVETFSRDGSPLPSVYSKTKMEEVKKAKDKLSKIDGSIAKALRENDFSKLKEDKG